MGYDRQCRIFTIIGITYYLVYHLMNKSCKKYHSFSSKIKIGFITLIILVIVYLLIRIFVFLPFKITSNSMSPTLKKGDIVVVNKLIYGIRINDADYSFSNKMPFHRIRGIEKVKRNDIIVFNYPYKEWDNWNEISFQPDKYYVKRCIALPGDSLYINDGIYELADGSRGLGDEYSQEYFKQHKSNYNLPDTIIPYSPKASIPWTVFNMGPLYIPQKGDIVQLDSINSIIYHNIIEWETNTHFFIQNTTQMTNYKFKNSYYFMGGDNVSESIDSRFWGLLPESFIIGKVSFTL